MAFGGGGGDPTVQSIPARPKESDKAVQEAVAEAIRRRARMRGYQSTVLSNMTEKQGGGKLQTLGS